MSHSLQNDNDENFRQVSLSNVCLEDSLTSNNGFGDLHRLTCFIPLENNEVGLLSGAESTLPSADPAGFERD